MTDKKQSSKLFNEFIKDYIFNPSQNNELEIRFGTKFYNPITRITFENVIKLLKSSSFTCSRPEYHLNIQNEYDDPNSGKTKISNVRTQIMGINLIQRFCKSNIIDPDNDNIVFMQKKSHRVNDEYKIDNNEFQFRTNFKEENILKKSHPLVKILLDSWEDSKKTFRYIKRYRLEHKNYPYHFDCSIVKTSKKQNKKPFFLVSEYNIQEADVFNNPESYEIELEMNPIYTENKSSFSEDKLNKIVKVIKNGIKLVLSGLQETHFPISYNEIYDIQKEYLSLIHFNDVKKIPNRRIRTKDFIGFSSISLEMDNIRNIDENNNIPNINNYYTVTEKADGIRKLLFINKKGKIYLMDTNMNIQFTGCITKHKANFNTIVDGEHVLHNSSGIFINLYLCFDIYILGGRDVRQFPFYTTPDIKFPSTVKKGIFRLQLLSKFINDLDHLSIVSSNKRPPLNIKSKTFYNNNTSSIFRQCNKILMGIDDGTMFDYETDGLIFTPSDKSVASNNITKNIPAKKTTWKHSLKWKPAKFNTIDFLVVTKKDNTGKDFIGNIYEDGFNFHSSWQSKKYKTLLLKVGFDENTHGFINPFKDIIEDKIPSFNKPNSRQFNNSYVPKNFYPSEPTPNFPIHICNILVDDNGILYTEDKKQIFQDHTIVEFRFEKNAKQHWQWVPIRVRHDKTTDYKKGLPNYGNAYHVAQSVWRSIHNPITEDMIATGNNIPEVDTNDSVYYNRKSNETYTRALRDFHNKYVKKKLIKSISNYGDILVDQSVGKAGDLSKWIESRLKFVMGIDYSLDNIQHRIDGACARYLNMCKKYKAIPGALFLQGNSSENIKNGNAFKDEKSKQIIDAVFGEGPKDEEFLGKGIYKYYGVAKNGFDIVSNQFSIHYFFENIDTYHNFIRNVSEFCKVGGYFIGTCYDGKKIFNMLKKKKLNESEFIIKDEKKIWEVIKSYHSDEFKNDHTSLGLQIDVYQESINKTFPEYLVNFDYFIQTLEHYGFVPISEEEYNKFHLPGAVNSFSELFKSMNFEIKSKKIKKENVGAAQNLSSEEKKISFLNNYFIFKKIRNPDAKTIANTLISNVKDIQFDNNQSKLTKSTIIPKRKDIKKLKKKFKLPK